MTLKLTGEIVNSPTKRENMMMYADKMAAAIKVNGRVLKEDKDKVYIPFGSEYSVYIKNLNTKKALAKIEIDGTSVSEGGFVVPANGSIDIERFVRSNYEGNRFKFIERTSQIEEVRGVGVEDGIVRISFQFARSEPEYSIFHGYPRHRDNSDVWRSNQYRFSDNDKYHLKNVPTVTCQTEPSPVRGILRGSSISTNSTVMNTSLSDVTADNENGITVPGSISNQKFTTVDSFPLESQEYVIVVKLLGKENDVAVMQVRESRQKPVCSTCEKVNPRNAKFCTRCGTSLVVV